MADNITFHQYNNLHDIEDSWRSLDQQAERLSLGYIHYTYYQTYEWNEFLYHHTLSGLGALTTAMRYDLVRVGGRPLPSSLWPSRGPPRRPAFPPAESAACSIWSAPTPTRATRR